MEAHELNTTPPREIVWYLVAVMTTGTNVEQFYPKVNGAFAPFYAFFSKRVQPIKKGIPSKRDTSYCHLSGNYNLIIPVKLGRKFYPSSLP